MTNTACTIRTIMALRDLGVIGHQEQVVLLALSSLGLVKAAHITVFLRRFNSELDNKVTGLILSRLRKKGLVRMHMDAPEDTRTLRLRKHSPYYALTRKAKDALLGKNTTQGVI